MSNLDNTLQEFNCNIPNLHTTKIMQRNGVSADSFEMPEGVVCKNESGILQIEIPENKHLKLPLQIVNILSENATIKSKLRISVGKNSKVQFIHCDDSYDSHPTTSVNTIDVLLDDDAIFDYYKMENLNNDSIIETDVNFHLQEGSQLSTYGFSLNGKQIRNTLNVFLNKPHAEAHLNGLYLMDKQQEVEIKVNVRHNAENCISNQLFKGILDDSAKANFLGHVFVDFNSKGTSAMQTNRNILLTDKAKVNTRPFLEIYNDDVKCSHGATIGQLDEDALFYLRSRGISLKSAKMLLMYAFCQEVLAYSSIEALRESISGIIKMRLQGELSACANCVFQCSQSDLLSI
jgi:Fe-S cluster assembly protein SufD